MPRAIPLTVGLALGLTLGASAGCVRIAASVAHPTALERQLLGEYDRLDEELVWASSVRGPRSDAVVGFETLRAEAIEQRAIQRYNEDDLEELKNARCIAESLDAHVVVRTCARVEKDEATRRLITRVVREENTARDAILLFAAHEIARRGGRVAPAPAELAELQKTYARLLREAAKPGQLAEQGPGDFREIARPAR